MKRGLHVSKAISFNQIILLFNVPLFPLNSHRCLYREPQATGALKLPRIKEGRATAQKKKKKGGVNDVRYLSDDIQPARE